MKLQASSLQIHWKWDSSTVVFSKEFYKIFKNTYFVEHLGMVASKELMTSTESKGDAYTKTAKRLTEATLSFFSVKHNINTNTKNW